MLDPETIESYFNEVYDRKNISVEVVFNNVDISPKETHTIFTYDFTLLYYDIYERTNVEVHINEVKDKINSLELKEPCDIIVSITVG
jgi:hypothetical protein